MSSGTSQQFCVRWNSRLSSLGTAFPQLLAGQRFVDVTLACEGHQLHCHRLVLAACSTYFESLLGENPCKHPIIILPRDIKLWEIQALVDFMYKGEVNVSQAGLSDLLKCAKILQIRGLCDSDAALNFNQVNSTTASSTSTTPMATTTPTKMRTAPCVSGANLSNRKKLSLLNQQLQHNQQQLHHSDPSPLYNKIKSEPQQEQYRTASRIQKIEPIDVSMDDDDSINPPLDKTDSFAGKYIDYMEGRKSEFPLANVICEYGSASFQTSRNNVPRRRIQRSETILRQAAECVLRGQTFKMVSDMFNIPISTIRFFMVRNGMLPKRRRGRSAGLSNAQLEAVSAVAALARRAHSRSASSSEPLFHFATHQLPETTTQASACN